MKKHEKKVKTVTQKMPNTIFTIFVNINFTLKPCKKCTNIYFPVKLGIHWKHFMLSFLSKNPNINTSIFTP